MSQLHQPISLLFIFASLCIVLGSCEVNQGSERTENNSSLAKPAEKVDELNSSQENFNASFRVSTEELSKNSFASLALAPKEFSSFLNF